MSEIRRIYVEKKDAFAVEAKGLLADLKNNLLMDGLEKVRILARYDVMGLTDEEFEQALQLVLSEPPVDTVMEALATAADENVFAVELLPGQYDQREDFAAQCIQLITQKEKPLVAAAKVYVLKGSLTDAGGTAGRLSGSFGSGHCRHAEKSGAGHECGRSAVDPEIF